EIAHQWFGDAITPTNWRDTWLNEGFATYAELVWLEHTSGQTAVRRQIADWYATWRTRSATPGNVTSFDDMFDDVVYERGALTLTALKARVGDGTFNQIIRTYLSRFSGGNASTEDFVAVASGVSGQDLHGFFRRWLYDPAMPDIPELGLFR